MSGSAPDPTIVTVDVAAESISPGGIYQFIPNMITASNGTIVSFRFSGIPGNHSVTQSTLVAPCQPLLNGFDSGFIEGKETKAGKFPTWNYTVTNDQSPIWFFCNQQTPSSHCRAGMVGVINGHASGFGNFQAKAEGIALASTASGPSQPTASLNPPQSKAPVPVGAIVGATIGALLFIALCLAAVLLCRRRRRNARLEAQLEEMRPDPLIVYEKGALPPEASGSVLSAILREVRSLRRQMGGQSVQPDDPPPKYSVS